MIDFTIHHKKEPLNNVIAVELPMNADNLSDLLQELGYEPPEKLKVNSKGKPYVIELNSDTNMGFAILERLLSSIKPKLYQIRYRSIAALDHTREAEMLLYQIS